MAEEKTPAMPVICLAGPTGAGKTALALTLCEELGGEVVNADSRQVYRDFPIITAQPSPEEQGNARTRLTGRPEPWLKSAPSGKEGMCPSLWEARVSIFRPSCTA